MSGVLLFDPITCTTCGRTRAPSAFPLVHEGGMERQTECRDCQTARQYGAGVTR